MENTNVVSSTDISKMLMGTLGTLPGQDSSDYLCFPAPCRPLHVVTQLPQFSGEDHDEEDREDNSPVNAHEDREDNSPVNADAEDDREDTSPVSLVHRIQIFVSVLYLGLFMLALICERFNLCRSLNIAGFSCN